MSTTTSFWDALDEDIDPPPPLFPERLPSNPAIRWRLLIRLARSGPRGLSHKEVRELAGARDRAAFLSEMTDALCDDLVDKSGPRYQLSPYGVNLIRHINPAAVMHFPITDFPFDAPSRVSPPSKFWRHGP